MRVIGIGLNKTGTTSLAAALNRLGIPCVHNPSLQKMAKILQRKLPEFQACCDYPVWIHWLALVAVYPKAKFILTWRPLDDWLVSRMAHVLRNQLRGRGWRSMDPEQDRRDWEQHNRAVREFFAGRQNFLELHICDGEGYEKLCPFLDLSQPAAAFPHKRRADEELKRLAAGKLYVADEPAILG